MVIPKRHLALFAAALLGLFVLPAKSQDQTQGAVPVVFRTLAVGNATIVSGLFYEYQGKSIPLPVDGMSLSAPLPSPPSGRIALYRQLPPLKPGDPPRRIPVAEAQLGKNGPCLLLLTAAADPTSPGATSISALPISDSWDAHPVETVRVFNFSRRRAAIQLEADTTELATTQSHVTPFPKNTRIVDMKVAILEKGEWLLVSGNPPAIIPRTRLIIVLTDMAPTPENPHPTELDIHAVYDDNPPLKPTPAQIALISAR